MREIQIQFDVSTTLRQNIRIIDDTYSPEEVIKGLKSGELATSIEYNAELANQTDWEHVAVVATGHPVALILMQEIDRNADHRVDEFRVIE